MSSFVHRLSIKFAVVIQAGEALTFVVGSSLHVLGLPSGEVCSFRVNGGELIPRGPV